MARREYFKHEELPQRFWDKVSVTGFCWNWTAGTNIGGYGSFGVNRTARMAHRLVYVSLVKSIENGLVLDHLCRNIKCVNPDHLEIVTLGENTLRGYSPSAMSARQTHCIHGHEYTIENTKIAKYQRVCRECNKARMVIYNASRPRKVCPVCSKSLYHTGYKRHIRNNHKNYQVDGTAHTVQYGSIRVEG